MRNEVVSIFDAMVGRMLAGVLNLSSAHPAAVCLMLVGLAALVGSIWLETLGVRFQRPRRSQESL